jgi:hypothetical protein
VTEGIPKTTEELDSLTPAARYNLNVSNPQYETAEVLRYIYDRNTKWISKGTVKHRSNILPQIINYKRIEFNLETHLLF